MRGYCMPLPGLRFRHIVARAALGAMSAACVSPSYAGISAPEKTLLASRKAIDNFQLEVYTSVLKSPSEEGTEYLDCYWVLGDNIRRDSYRNGGRDDVFYREYCKPGEVVFFTNELTEQGGRVVVEIRNDDSSFIPRDPRTVVYGNGTLRQPLELLQVVGGHAAAARTVKPIEYEGKAATEVKYTADDVSFRMVLDDHRSFEPLLIEASTGSGTADVRSVATVERLHELGGPRGEPQWLPARIVIRDYIGGELKAEVVEELRDVKLGTVSPDTFSLPSLRIPVGHPVRDYRGPDAGKAYVWNGKEPEREQASDQLASHTTGDPWRTLTTFVLGTLTAALFIAMIIVRLRRAATNARP